MVQSTLLDRLEVYWDSRFYGGLFLIFAAIALLLASVGLYAVIAHSVSQRTQELGIRMAIGATAQDIVGLVFRQGMIPLGIGLIIGLAASLAVNQVLKSMLVKVSPSDPITLVGRIRRVGFVGDAGVFDSGAPGDAGGSGGRAEA